MAKPRVEALVMRRPSRFGSFETVEPLDVSPMTEPIPGWGYIGLYNKHGFIHTYVPLVGDIMYIGDKLPSSIRIHSPGVLPVHIQIQRTYSDDTDREEAVLLAYGPNCMVDNKEIQAGDRVILKSGTNIRLFRHSFVWTKKPKGSSSSNPNVPEGENETSPTNKKTAKADSNLRSSSAAPSPRSSSPPSSTALSTSQSQDKKIKKLKKTKPPSSREAPETRNEASIYSEGNGSLFDESAASQDALSFGRPMSPSVPRMFTSTPSPSSQEPLISSQPSVTLSQPSVLDATSAQPDPPALSGTTDIQSSAVIERTDEIEEQPSQLHDQPDPTLLPASLVPIEQESNMKVDPTPVITDSNPLEGDLASSDSNFETAMEKSELSSAPPSRPSSPVDLPPAVVDEYSMMPDSFIGHEQSEECSQGPVQMEISDPPAPADFVASFEPSDNLAVPSNSLQPPVESSCDQLATTEPSTNLTTCVAPSTEEIKPTLDMALCIETSSTPAQALSSEECSSVFAATTESSTNSTKCVEPSTEEIKPALDLAPSIETSTTPVQALSSEELSSIFAAIAKPKKNRYKPPAPRKNPDKPKSFGAILAEMEAAAHFELHSDDAFLTVAARRSKRSAPARVPVVPAKDEVDEAESDEEEGQEPPLKKKAVASLHHVDEEHELVSQYFAPSVLSALDPILPPDQLDGLSNHSSSSSNHTLPISTPSSASSRNSPVSERTTSRVTPKKSSHSPPKTKSSSKPSETTKSGRATAAHKKEKVSSIFDFSF